ncbi:MAG: hypothetical protein ACP5NF_11385 [Thermoanaerobaculum sp.]
MARRRFFAVLLSPLVLAFASLALAQGKLRVKVVDDAGSAINDRPIYLALVQEGQLVSELEVPASKDWPLLEAPAGPLTLVCSAEGFVFRAMPVNVKAGEETLETCRLSRLAPICGQVIDGTTGKPIAGARVEFASVFLQEQPLTTTAFLKQMVAKHVGISNQEGSFCLWAKPKAPVDLVVSAKGYARKVVSAVQATENGEPLGPVALDPGGTVEVYVDLPPDERTNEKWWLELVPAPELRELPPEEPAGRQPNPRETFAAVFSAPVPEDGWVRFESVPPGTYGAMLTTIPSRLLRKTGGKLPADVKFRPSQWVGPFYLGPGALQSVTLTPIRVRLRGTVTGMAKESVESLLPYVYLPNVNYGSRGKWLEVKDDRAVFEAILEETGTWEVGLESPRGTRFGVPLGTVTVTKDQKEANFQADLNVAPLQLEVRTRQGHPPQWVDVAVSSKDLCSPMRFAWHGRADAQGKVFLPAVPHRPLTIWAYSSQNEGSAYLEVEGPGRYQLDLQRGRDVSFVVRDEKGAPAGHVVGAYFRPLRGLELAVPSHPVPPSVESRVVGLPEVDGELLLADFSSEGQEVHAPIRIRLDAKKRGYLGKLTLERGGDLHWEAKNGSFVAGASAILLEKDEVFFRFPLSNEGFSIGFTMPGDSLLRFENRNLPPGRYRVVPVDEECQPLRYSKPFWIYSGRKLNRQDP